MNWTELHHECPVTKKWAFFDHAAVAPITARAQRAIRDWAYDLAVNGVAGEAKWLKRAEDVRKLCARLINADAEEIAFVKNTTEGIGFVAEGFPWRPGDNVVTAAEEYPTNLYPWMNLASKGVETRLVQSRGARLCVDDVRAQMDERTRIVSLSFVEYASGFRNDLQTIGQTCRERNVFFLVDAIQGLGVIPLDVKSTPIDALSADGHKWLLGPEGLGVFWIRRELIDRLHPICVGWNSVVGAWDFGAIDFKLKPDATRWEGGTLNFAGIHGLGASIELLLEIGIETIHDRVMELTDYVCERAQSIGLNVFSSRDSKERSGIVSVLPGNADAKEIVHRCRNEGIVINHRAGRLRVSPHCYNTVEEIDLLMRVMETC